VWLFLTFRPLNVKKRITARCSIWWSDAHAYV
jgi:hypothetical protein